MITANYAQHVCRVTGGRFARAISIPSWSKRHNRWFLRQLVIRHEGKAPVQLPLFYVE